MMILNKKVGQVKKAKKEALKNQETKNQMVTTMILMMIQKIKKKKTPKLTTKLKGQKAQMPQKHLMKLAQLKL
jgi:hypothetical protein